MAAGHRQLESDFDPIGESHPRLRPPGVLPPDGDAEIGGTGPEAPHRPGREPGSHPIGARPVIPDQDAAGPGREGHVGRLHRVNGAVALQMVGFDVVDHRDGWRKRQERLIVFIGLHHEEVGPTDPGIATPIGHPPAG